MAISIEQLLPNVAPAASVKLDSGRMFRFFNSIMDDMAGAMATFMCALGDRLGLFAQLATSGPVTADELAELAGVDRRYVSDWLGALAARGYLDYQPESERFTLPIEHAAALAADGGPMFMGGAYEQVPGLVSALDLVAEGFRSGGGVAPEAYDEHMHRGMERISAGWFEHQLVPVWIAALPNVRDALQRGAEVADLGCGAGRALVALARAFPESRFTGFDVSREALDRARENVSAAGVSERVRLEPRDVGEGLPGSYDLITCFDVLHDIARPLEVLAGVRRALRRDGTCLILEINCSERREHNIGAVSTLLYATSVLYCLPTAIALGAEGLGTMGLPEPRVHELCLKAGFSGVHRVPVSNPFNILYEIRR